MKDVKLHLPATNERLAAPPSPHKSSSMALQRLTAFGVGLANNEQAVTRKLSLLYRRDIADLGLAPVAQQPASGSTSTSTSTTAGAAPAAAAPAGGSGSGPGPCTPPDDTSTRLLAQLGIHPPCFAHPEVGPLNH